MRHASGMTKGVKRPEAIAEDAGRRAPISPSFTISKTQPSANILKSLPLPRRESFRLTFSINTPLILPHICRALSWRAWVATGLTLGRSGVRDWPRPVGEAGDCGKAERSTCKASKFRPLREPRTYGFGPGSAIRGAATSAGRSAGHRFDYKQRVVGPFGNGAPPPFNGRVL